MKKGDKVHWNWGKSEAEGEVQEKFTEPVSKNIKGSEVKLKASKENPSWLIKQENGSEVLKSEKANRKANRLIGQGDASFWVSYSSSQRGKQSIPKRREWGRF